MTDDNSVWRDEERLPLRELDRVVARSTPDGQVDDTTGNDAGEEATFGHGPEPADQLPAEAEERAQLADPDRAYRPSTTGRSGPH
jgi:hypothetical protein